MNRTILKELLAKHLRQAVLAESRLQCDDLSNDRDSEPWDGDVNRKAWLNIAESLVSTLADDLSDLFSRAMETRP